MMLPLTTRRSLLPFLAAALPLAFADVEFLSPAAGAVIPVGALNVAWKESGRPPVILELSEYTLNLVVGGNEVNNSLSIFNLVSGGTFINSSVTSIIPATITAPMPNGFYLEMICTDRNGGYITDYSDRFTLTGMTGVVASIYLNAAKDLHDNTDGPERSGNVPAITSGLPSSTSISTSTQQTITVTSAVKTSQTAPTSPPSADSYSLSMGAIVGIVIAALIGTSALLALIIFILLRRRRQKLRDGVIDNVDSSAFGHGMKSPASWKQPSVTTLSELSADGRVMEMGDGQPPPEMDSMAIRAELEGDLVHQPLPPMRQGSAASSVWEPQTPLTPITPSVFEETLQGPVDFMGSPVTPITRV